MGICMSSGGGAEPDMELVVCASTTTAMVLLPNGEMREYPRPAAASHALEECAPSTGKWFLCDADAMVGFDGPLPSVDGKQELRPGRIFFVLPDDARRNGLRREEIAKLAVTASAALVKKAAAGSGGGSGRQRRSRAGSVAPLVFAPPEEEGKEYESGDCKAAAKSRRVKRSGGRFAPDLTAIPELDMTSE